MQHPPAVRTPSALTRISYLLELYGLYFAVALRLKRQGLKKTVAHCTTLRPRAHPRSEEEEAELVRLTKALTRRVLKWHVLPNSCVPDALLACWFLARHGVKADFVIIVRQYPFMAHAQARWRDLPLTEAPPSWSLPETYVTLMRK